MNFERAYAQGVIAGIGRCQRRVTRLQVAFLLTIGIGVVAVGAAWDHPNQQVTVVKLVAPVSSLSLTSSQRAQPAGDGDVG